MKFSELNAPVRAYLMSGTSVELISPPGRGKSSWVYDFVEHMTKTTGVKWGLSIAMFANYSPTDVGGVFFKGSIETSDGPVTVTDPAMPPWMVSTEGKPLWEYDAGILFLDEWGQAQPETKASGASLVLEKRTGKWKLPKGWHIIMASNRMGDRSAVTRSLDFVINRRAEIHITDDLDGWVDWATQKGINPLFLSFAAKFPTTVFSNGVPEKQGPWCTPRSFVMAAKAFDLLTEYNGGKTPLDAVTKEAIAGMIGDGAAEQLFGHLRNALELPGLSEVIADPEHCRLPERADLQLISVYQLAANANDKNMQQLCAYVSRMSPDFHVTFAVQILRRSAALVVNQHLRAFSQKNSAIIAQINSMANR